jgi:hypothetical protein
MSVPSRARAPTTGTGLQYICERSPHYVSSVEGEGTNYRYRLTVHLRAVAAQRQLHRERECRLQAEAYICERSQINVGYIDGEGTDYWYRLPFVSGHSSQKVASRTRAPNTGTGLHL